MCRQFLYRVGRCEPVFILPMHVIARLMKPRDGTSASRRRRVHVGLVVQLDASSTGDGMLEGPACGHVLRRTPVAWCVHGTSLVFARVNRSACGVISCPSRGFTCLRFRHAGRIVECRQVVQGILSCEMSMCPSVLSALCFAYPTESFREF